MTITTFSIPKAGHDAEENEDATATSPPDAWPLRAAVADGATETVFARAWAQRLARGFAESEIAGAEAFGVRLELWRAAWYDTLQAKDQMLPWYAQEKAKEGAHAAFLGLTANENGTWHALAAGDCCLFHVRRGDVLTHWPITDPDAFSHTPPLLSSLPDADVPTLETQTGPWRAGDAFVLASDAVAAWLMRTGAAQALAWTDEATFEAAARAAREDGALRNDDATLVVVGLP